MQHVQARPIATPTRVRRWPWVVAAASVPVFVLGNVLYPSDEAQLAFTLLFSAIIGSFVGVGALLATRVPANPIGPILLGSGASLAITVTVGSLGIVGAERGASPELLAIAGIVNDVGFLVPIVLIMVVIPLIYPDGRLLSPRWRWVVALVVAGVAAEVVKQVVGPRPLGPVAVANPFAVPALFPIVPVLDAFASLTTVAFVASVASVALRYRRAGDIERHQLKWLIAVAGVAAISLPLALAGPFGVVADVALQVGLFAVLALPIAIAVAILRYRLYEIDRIISRTIAWAIISGLLGTAFIGLVVGLQAALVDVTQGDTLAVAASTLVAVALFQPVRGRVQRFVDRRFDRARYDAQRTADAFAERLRYEVDLDTLAGELERTVAGAVRPTAAQVWLPPRASR